MARLVPGYILLLGTAPSCNIVDFAGKLARQTELSPSPRSSACAEAKRQRGIGSKRGKGGSLNSTPVAIEAREANRNRAAAAAAARLGSKQRGAGRRAVAKLLE